MDQEARIKGMIEVSKIVYSDLGWGLTILAALYLVGILFYAIKSVKKNPKIKIKAIIFVFVWYVITAFFLNYLMFEDYLRLSVLVLIAFFLFGKNAKLNYRGWLNI